MCHRSRVEVFLRDRFQIIEIRRTQVIDIARRIQVSYKFKCQRAGHIARRLGKKERKIYLRKICIGTYWTLQLTPRINIQSKNRHAK